MRSLLMAIGVVSLGLSVSGCAHGAFLLAVRAHSNSTFSQPVEGAFSKLEVGTASGDVTIRVEPGATFSVKGRIEAWAPTAERAKELAERYAVQPPVEGHGDTLRVGHLREHTDWNEGVSIDYDIVAPPEAAMNIVSASGDIEVAGPTGEVSIESASGRVGLRDVGAARIRAASGNVTVDGVRGDLRIESSSGDVSVTAEPRAQAKWRVDASSGDVTLRVPPTSSFRFDAATASGDVKSDLPIRVRGRVEHDELHGEVGQPSEAVVQVNTSSGDISLRE